MGAAPPPAVTSEAPPVVMDDWSLVRNSTGQSGWVLTRRLTMAIPDEVAQYAEGRRIMSYLPLGEVHDRELVKPSWVWTTVERGLQPYDFDSFRVFVWSLRHHRYETGHIERNLKGFFPVLTHPVTLPKAKTAGKVPGFSILIEKKDGNRYRRSYAFVENRVRFSGEERVETTTAPAAPDPARSLTASTVPARAPSFGERILDWRRRLFGR
jgi:hypothetical protein